MTSARAKLAAWNAPLPFTVLKWGDNRADTIFVAQRTPDSRRSLRNELGRKAAVRADMSDFDGSGQKQPGEHNRERVPAERRTTSCDHPLTPGFSVISLALGRGFKGETR